MNGELIVLKWSSIKGAQILGTFSQSSISKINKICEVTACLQMQ